MGDDDLLLKKNKKSRLEDEAEGIDRISRLPDELIHHILSHLEAQLAVQLCILSKRWKFVWKTLPFLDFSWYKPEILSNGTETKFVESFLSNRNNQHEVSKMKLSFPIFYRPKPSPSIVYNFITCAFQQNVQTLDVEIQKVVGWVIKLSTFSSNSLKELNLKLSFLIRLLESDCWDLPVLTNLHWTWSYLSGRHKLPESYLICLSSLQTLFLDGFELPNSITLPVLTHLHLKNCKISQNFWNLPNLFSLTLANVQFPKDLSDFFPALVNLRNLTLFFQTKIVEDFFIKCPQLVNLEIITSMTITISPSVKIIVVAPKICKFSSDGFFPITFGDSELENVNIKLQKSIRYKDSYGRALDTKIMKNYYRKVEQMFAGLGSAKILTLDLETIKALTAIQDVLVDSPSPFYNLKYVKIPTSYNESCISACLKRYLLGRCPDALIVTTLPKNNLIARFKVTSVRAQHVAPQEPLEAPTKVSTDSADIPKSASVDTVNMGFQAENMGGQEEHMVHNSIIHAEEKGSDQVISSRGNSDFGLWRGHEVKSEFVCLLDLIISKYPETFENFNAKGKRVCTMNLNMLCTSIYDFTKISLTEVNTEIIAEYRNVFAFLQDMGFNLSWLVCHLNYIEQLCLSQPLVPQLHSIDCHIDNAKNKLKDLESRVNAAKNKLQDLHTLRVEKMQEIEKAFGAMGTKLAVGNIGDHLFTTDP